MDSRCIFMAHGVILKHLEVDKITWGGVFSKKRKKGASLFGAPFKRGADSLFGGKGAGHPFFN
jgi:hypothetical protein